MLRTRIFLALLMLSAALLAPRPVAAQSFVCDALNLLPKPVRAAAGPYLLQERTVIVEGYPLELRFCTTPAQSRVTQRMLDLAARSLPVLDELTDVQLDGSNIRIFYMDSSENVYSLGADGYTNSYDHKITLHPRSQESTVVHEVAHYWADRDRFAELWMVEAYAEYLSELAMARMNLPYTPEPAGPECDGLPLTQWQRENPFTGLCPYTAGPAVLRELTERAGQDNLRVVLGALSRRPEGVTSRALLTELEHVSGANLSPVMRGRVFGPELDAALAERSAVRERLAGVAGLAQSLGMGLPASIADDLYAWRHGEAGATLGAVEQVLPTIQATLSRCELLGLPCVRPWEGRGAAPGDWPAVADQLAAAAPLLSEYERLAARSAELGLPVPERARQAAAALGAEYIAALQSGATLLERARELEARCAGLGIDCRPHWVGHWQSGELPPVSDALQAIGGALDQGAGLEAACGTLADLCGRRWREAFAAGGPPAVDAEVAGLRALLADGTALDNDCRSLVDVCGKHWRAALRQGGPQAAAAAIGELRVLLADAAALEVACDDIAGACAEGWRIALRADGPAGAAAAIDGFRELLKAARTGEARCADAGWPCAEGWRQALAENGTAAARLLLEDQARALPELSAVAAKIAESFPVQVQSQLPGAAQVAGDPLADAKAAFAAGDVAEARRLVAAAQQQGALTGTALIAVAVAGALAAGVLGAWLFTATRRRGRRGAPPSSGSPGGPRKGGPPAGGDLLNDLLKSPPKP